MWQGEHFNPLSPLSRKVLRPSVQSVNASAHWPSSLRWNAPAPAQCESTAFRPRSRASRPHSRTFRFVVAVAVRPRRSGEARVTGGAPLRSLYPSGPVSLGTTEKHQRQTLALSSRFVPFKVPGPYHHHRGGSREMKECAAASIYVCSDTPVANPSATHTNATKCPAQPSTKLHEVRVCFIGERRSVCCASVD